MAPRLFQASLEATRVLSDEPALAESASTLLTLCHAFGARRKEALYSLKRDYTVRQGALAFQVLSNSANKVKNPTHGTRLVPFGLAGDDSEQFLRAVVSSASTDPRSDKPIFADPTAIDHYQDFQPVTRIASAALKLSAGNAKMTLHGERHGFGTRLGMAVMPIAGRVASVRRIRQELAVEPAVVERIAALEPRRDDWPFQVDRASMWHGNAAVDTYLDVYFHGGSWLLAEEADANAIDDLMNPGHWAALMFMNRTNIVHLRSAWRKEESSEERTADLSDERVVAHFLARLKLDSAVRSDAPARSRLAGNSKGSRTVARRRLTLASCDKLLVVRVEQRWGLDEAALNAVADMCLDQAEVQRFIKAYREIAADTGFVDFEPPESDLLPVASDHRAGVVRTAPRRQALLSRFEDLRKQESNRNATNSMLSRWRQWVDPKRPMLVGRQTDDMKQVIDILLELGFGRREMRLLMTPSWLNTNGDGSINGLLPEYGDHARLSRGPAGIPVEEVGIEIVGRLEESLVSNADLHRALAVASALFS